MDHAGNVLFDIFEEDGYNPDDLILSALNRPLDARATLDRMLELNEKAGHFFQGTIIPEAVGISGHSFGGFTSLHQGFDDSRIKAVVAHAPATSPLGIMGFKMAEFPVPAMLMAGTLDGTLAVEKEMAPAYEKMPPPKFFFELLTGGHFTYSDICLLDLVYIAEDLGIDDAGNALDDGCADFNVSTDIAHPLIRQFGIGFFNHYLRNSSGSLEYFDGDAAAAAQEHLFYKYEM